MIVKESLRKWRYYFIDLPLWAFNIRSSRLEKRMFKVFESEIPSIREGIRILYDYLNKPIKESDIDTAIEKSLWVRVVRESDAFSSLKMSKKRLDKYFRIEGIEHLKTAKLENRPVILLTGHVGSFFIPAIAFSHIGFHVYPVARKVDHSPATPCATRLYLTLNYKLSEMRFSTRYIYSDFSGRIDRNIIRIGRTGGILWTAIDIPKRLYPYKRCSVILFGRPSSLPSGVVQWGIKKNAVFLTAWNKIETSEKGSFYRFLTIDPPISKDYTLRSILQTYADRLSEQIGKQPWQWMGLPIIKQYDETRAAQDV